LGNAKEKKHELKLKLNSKLKLKIEIEKQQNAMLNQVQHDGWNLIFGI